MRPRQESAGLRIVRRNQMMFPVVWSGLHIARPGSVRSPSCGSLTGMADTGILDGRAISLTLPTSRLAGIRDPHAPSGVKRLAGSIPRVLGSGANVGASV